MRVMFKKKKEWPLAFVDEINCVGCEKCVDECPFDAIVEAKKCTGCRICEWACPYDAIFIYPKNEVPDWLQSSFLPRDDSRSEEIEWRKFRTPAFDSDQEEQDAAAAGNE